jgi:peptidoglycan/LPS O-acetylase OafA/YrhL
MNQDLHRIRGLDSIRFLAALVVAVEHNNLFPLTVGFDPSSVSARMVNGFYTGSVSGPAAVIVFFVISGFCIHYPYVNRKFNLPEFYSRRILRIILPLFAAVILIHRAGFAVGGSDWFSGVPAWSLIAEMAYYLLYPVLRRLRSRLSWRTLFQISFVTAFLFAFTKPVTNVNYPAWNNAGNCLIGLPCWLLGVLLAEREGQAAAGAAPSKSQLWRWRSLILMIAAITHNLALQRLIGQHLTLNFFALAVYPWLRVEIAHFRRQPPWPVLEWAGRWSYSLYLLHPFGHYLVVRLNLPNFGYLANWLIELFLVLLLSYIFFLLVEAPGHRLARAAGHYFRRHFPTGAAVEPT